MIENNVVFTGIVLAQRLPTDHLDPLGVIIIDAKSADTLLCKADVSS